LTEASIRRRGSSSASAPREFWSSGVLEFWTQLELVRGVAIAPEEPAGDIEGRYIESILDYRGGITHIYRE